ncbi:hypothetical protein sos41_25590 [Alphaproteobacteria bacterium SO-S41]|nr:hypothetical protein sos41_25590 [Alphaproteobacteria bacterium SO-S41]
MKGKVGEYNEATESGAIVNANGRRFTFTRTAWQGDKRPAPGLLVVFAPEGTTAEAITLADTGPEFYPDDRTIVWLWTSLEGPATRFDFWVRFILAAVPIILIAGLIDNASGTRYRPSYTFGIIANILLFWPGLAVGIKRFHDRNMPGYHVVVLLLMEVGVTILLAILIDQGIVRSRVTVYAIQAIPFLYGLWQFVIIGFLRGTDGDNDYGPDPLDTYKSDFTPRLRGS